jgi:hypothetical protein
MGDDSPVYVAINCLLKKNGAHMHTRQSASHSKLFRMQGHFMEQMWIITGPNPSVLAVRGPCFITGENQAEQVYSIFLDKCMKPPAIL